MSGPLLLRGFVAFGAWTLETTALLLVAGVIVLLCRKNAARRHSTWRIAFSVLLLTPGFTALLPARFVFRVPLRSPIQHSAPAASNAHSEEGAQQSRIFSPAHYGAFNTVMTEADIPFIRAMQILYGCRPIVLGLLSLWLVGVALVATQGVAAVYGIALLRRNSVPGDFTSVNLPDLAAKLGFTRDWELRVSTMATPPAAMTWGFVHPVVLLPQDAAIWPKERLEVVLLHELAHVRRCDSLSQLLALCVCSLYWFHPAVWLCARAMRADAEAAADDAVLRSGLKPSTYAAELLRLAAQLGLRRQPYSGIGVSITKHSKIEARILSILDPSNRRREPSSLEALNGVGLGVGALLLLASLHPSVSFADERQAAPGASGARWSIAFLHAERPTDARAEAADLSRRINKNRSIKKSTVGRRRVRTYHLETFPDRPDDNGRPKAHSHRRRAYPDQKAGDAKSIFARAVVQPKVDVGKISDMAAVACADAKAGDFFADKQKAYAIEDMRRGLGNAHGQGEAAEAAAQLRDEAIIKAAHNAADAARTLAEADEADARRRQVIASQLSKDDMLKPNTTERFNDPVQ